MRSMVAMALIKLHPANLEAAQNAQTATDAIQRKSIQHPVRKYQLCLLLPSTYDIISRRQQLKCSFKGFSRRPEDTGIRRSRANFLFDHNASLEDDRGQGNQHC